MAVLDLGTNNCRLLIAAEAAGGSFRVVDSFSRIVRLGEGVGQTARMGGDGARDRWGLATAAAVQGGGGDGGGGTLQGAAREGGGGWANGGRELEKVSCRSGT